MLALASIRYKVLLVRAWLRESSIAPHAFSTESSPRQSRGSLPRFHSQILPTSKGEIARIEGDEFWHMTRVLRLGVNARVELFNGTGGLLQGCIQSIDKNGSDIIALEEPRVLYPEGIQWHIFSAFGTLKGGRADWLIEKCTELGANSITPLLTERSPTISDNRVDRSASTQDDSSSSHEAPNITSIYFTEEEVRLMVDAGATPVGLGPCRLRVETATIAMLSTLMLWSDTLNYDTR